MLIRFTAKNIFSIKDEIELNMLAANNIRKHVEHVYIGKSRNDLRLLKTALIYGPNASGKSNIIKAMKFAKDLIVFGTDSGSEIPFKPFKLDETCLNEPSKLEFEFSYNKKNYAYGFEFNSDYIIEEWLYEIGKTKESPIYERKAINNDASVVELHIKYKDEEEEQFLKFVAKGTRPNQLFLTESIARNVSQFRDVYNWFKNVLTIVFPDTVLGNIDFLIKSDKNFYKLYGNIFNTFDTGIYSVKPVEIDIDKDLPDIPPKLKLKIQEDLKNENTFVFLRSFPSDDRFTIYKDRENNLKARKIYTVHKNKELGKEIVFDLKEESDGTRRLFDIIPALIDLKMESRVFIFDEINRSLHPQLTYKLFEFFLKLTREHKSQIIATTHELNLLDLKLFRRDEIWFVEKDTSGASKLYSLQEYKPRHDKDIEKGYLQGRYGAIPIVHRVEDLGW